MRAKIAVIAAVVGLAAAGFAAADLLVPAAAARSDPATTTSTQIASTATTVVQTSSVSTSTTVSPQQRRVLPRKTVTPGAYNASVRQQTIEKTICRRGWTATIRPPVDFTNALKLQQMQLYGETGSPSTYEEDHFIPLELGGAPRNPRNLWPEPRAQSRRSDPLETTLKRKVCRGVITLAKARAAIRTFKNRNG
jgi:hypothetical protein